MDLKQLEALALSEDRDAVVQSLVPGTDEHSFWLAVRHQHRGELDKVDAILEQWRLRYGHHEGLDIIERRQLLLKADRDLPGQAEAVRTSFGISLDHEPQVEQAAARYPSRLDPTHIRREAIVAAAFRKDRGLGTLRDEALPWVLANRKLDATRRRQLLSRLARGGQPKLIEAIAEDLKESGSGGFLSLQVHQKLTLDELDALAKRRPDLAADPDLIKQRMMRELPPPHVDIEDDLAARVAHIERLQAICEGLPPIFTSIRAHLAYHRLDCDLRAGVVDRRRLLAYLGLPRRVSYLRSGMLDGLEASKIADLDTNHRSYTGLPPVRDDEPLVRRMLSALLEKEEPHVFSHLLDARWLEQIWATARLCAGAPQPERYAERLGAAAVRALHDRVDIELLPTNPRLFSRDQPVHLDVAIKNAWPLRVRVFPIDTFAYASARGGEVPLDLDLDGLTASHERILTSDLPSLRREVRRIEIPEASKPGTYIIELIGGGRASRALIRKGELRAVSRRAPQGLAVTVIDERGERAPGAWIRMGGRDYHPRADGEISLPFSTQPGATSVLLCDTHIASPTTLQLPEESPSLALEIWLDRAMLLPGREARMLLRTLLQISGQEVPLSLLEQPFLEVRTRDRSGIETVKRSPIVLRDGVETEHTFPVPERLETLQVSLGGVFLVQSRQQRVDLRVDRSVEVGTIHREALTEALYLRRSAEGYQLALLGKSGEPRPGRAVQLELLHRLSDAPVEVTLATDDTGQIALGDLEEIVEIRATPGRPPTQVFDLRPIPPVYPSALHVLEGRPVVLPVPVDAGGAKIFADEVRLVEIRGGHPSRELPIDAIEPGLLRIAPLPPGEYELSRAGAPDLPIRVFPGASAREGRFASTSGELAELQGPHPAIESAEIREEKLSVRIINPGRRTRVHLLGLSLWPAPAWSADLSIPLARPDRIAFERARSGYISGRDIGDEYRYVLERRSQPKRPSLLLQRPGLLLNPFALRAVQTRVQHAAPGGGWGAAASAAPMASSAMRASRYREERAASRTVDASFASYDLLDAPPALLANLAPDAEGLVECPLGDLGGASLVLVVCVDPRASTARLRPLPPSPLRTADLRLRAGLPAGRDLREDKRLLPCPGGERKRLPERTQARLAWVDSVEVLYRALCALCPDPDLSAWSFLPRWGLLPRSERLELYSKHACHELALFIYHRDRPLFDEVIRPYLANKLQPTFIDRWLLGEDLSSYLQPRYLARLNAFERALLAHALPSARASLVRALSDEVDRLPPDPERYDRLVDVLLADSKEGGSEEGGGDDDERAAPEALEESPEEALSELDHKPADASLRKGKRSLTISASDDGDGFADLAARSDMAPLYRSLDQTKEWAEHNWRNQRPGPQDPSFLEPSRLWRDLAAHEGGPFLSPHLADGAASFAAALCALAVTDLPFAAGPHEARPDGAGLSLRSESHALCALSLLGDALRAKAAEILIGQSTLRDDDRFEWEGSEHREKYVTGELIAGVVYEDRLAVTNPTSRTQELSVLVQIPAGSMPVSGAMPTRNHRLTLEPYATSTIETAFYFPFPGRFSWYGARVVRGESLLAAAPDREVEVVQVPTALDAASWPHVSQRGSLAEVLGFLRDRNLGFVDLSQIAWRMKDASAFAQITAALSARHIYDETLWSYALMHHDRARYAEWLMLREGSLDDLGPLELSAGPLDPVERGTAPHLEYAPLVSARAHVLGSERVIPNEGLSEQWRRLLTRLATTASRSPRDRLAAAHYLLAMDRQEEAAASLALAPRPEVSAKLQHDYMSAYLAAASGDLARARLLSEPHATHPVERWRRPFAMLVEMLDEIEGRTPVRAPSHEHREARMDELSSRTQTLAARFEGQQLLLEHTNLERASVRLYRMDVELLFSRQPFVGADVDRFTFIEPTASLVPELSPSGRTAVALPGELSRSDIVAEVRGGPLRCVLTRYAGDLSVALAAPYGQLQVKRQSTGASLPAAYVKAYARKRGGTVQFYKDGYTDPRGRFDYATLSTNDLDDTERFAILIHHDDAGATVIEADPPLR